MMPNTVPSPLLALDDAIAKLAIIIKPLRETRLVSLREALGHALAQTVLAPYALPPFDNTGVDGYAFRHAEAVASQGKLKLIGASLAGQPFTGEYPASSAIHIATGAMLPSAFDTVVMQEHCQVEGDQLFIDQIPSKGANIRQAGADIKKGDVALITGHCLRAGDIALLGALGFTDVKTIRPIRVAIASTGAELRGEGAALGPGQIIDTNSLMLRQLLAPFPVEVTMLGALPDDRAETDAVLGAAAHDHDLVISTGGVSVGRRDYVRDALQALGQLHFWKLAIRPGRPVMLGQIGRCYMLGLPGNPVSALVTFCLVARPILLGLMGAVPALPPAFFVPLAGPVKKEKNLRCFLRAKLEVRHGAWHAVPYDDQSSNLLTSLARSDGLLDIAPGDGECAVGTLVLFRPFSGFYTHHTSRIDLSNERPHSGVRRYEVGG